MNYSTLKEVYNVDTFEKERKKPKRVKEVDEQRPQLQPARETVCFKDDGARQGQQGDVMPYYDEDLEQYLNVEDFQNAIPYIQSKRLSDPQQKEKGEQHEQGSTDPLVYKKHVAYMIEPVAEPQAVQAPQAVQPVQVAEVVPDKKAVPDTQDAINKSNLFYKNLINIGLFIFVGVLIIFLCDQITEIAINIGMKRTVAILEPYLIDLRERNRNASQGA